MICKISASLLKTHHHHFAPLALPPPPPSSKPSFLRIRFALQSSLQAASRSPSVSSSLPYGPSIHKGATPPPYSSEVEDGSRGDGRVVLDEEKFTRVFAVTALRVPSSESFSLESRLRGHLLNWPRIPNIVRVPGDEVDEETARLIGSGAALSGDADGSDGGVDLDVVERRVFGRARGDGEEEALGGVLCRDELANTFNSRGYVRFRNLAKISRPKRRRKKEEGDSVSVVVGRRGNRKSNFAIVEVVDEEEDEEDVHRGGDMMGLLGVVYKRQWRGSTRLLLLDERCVGKPLENLPEAIKVADLLV